MSISSLSSCAATASLSDALSRSAGVLNPAAAASVRAASTSASTSTSTASSASSAAALAQAGQAGSTVSVAVPGSPFVQQLRISPGSLVATPQIPPLLFDSQAETLLSSAVGSLVDTTA